MFGSTGGVPGSAASAGGAEAVAPAMVTIVVKNVYRNTSIELALPETEALSSVKAAIREKFEEHPAPDQQRLIYLGKVCVDDGLQLKDIISSSKMDAQTPQTFHLVLSSSARAEGRPEPQPTQPVARSPEPILESETSAEQQQQQQPQQLEHAVAVAGGEGLRRRRPHGEGHAEEAGQGQGQDWHGHTQPQPQQQQQQGEAAAPHYHHADVAALHAQWYHAAYAHWSSMAAQHQMYYGGMAGPFPYPPGMPPASFGPLMSPYGAGAPAFGPYSPTSLPPGSPLPAMYTAASPPVYHAPMPVTTTYTAAFAPPMDPPHAEAQPQAPPTVHHNANAPAAPQPAPTVAEPGFWALTATVERMRQVMRLFDWQLAVKMVMLVVLLNPSDPRRLVTLSLVASLAFLYQTGIMGLLLGPLFQRRRDDDADDLFQPRNHDQPPAEAARPPQPGANDGQVGGGGPQGQAQAGAGAGAPKGFVQKVAGLGRGTIPAGSGLAMDVVVFLSSIVLSLFPTWQPTAEEHFEAPEPQPAPEVAAVQG